MLSIYPLARLSNSNLRLTLLDNVPTRLHSDNMLTDHMRENVSTSRSFQDNQLDSLDCNT